LTFARHIFIIKTTESEKEGIIMDFFDGLRDKIMTTGKDVSEKARETAAVAKLKAQIAMEENKLKVIYAELGKAYYENPEDENIEAYKDSIEMTKNVIAGYQSDLANRKGLKKCSNCGATMAKEVLFCSKCGAKNEIPEEEAAEETEEETGGETGEPTAEEEPKKRVCPVCEAEVTDDMAFCEVCGTKLDD